LKYNVITSDRKESLMRTHLVRIGNSRGVRLPKPLIVQAGLTDEVELRVQGGAIIIERPADLRCGWADAARKMCQRGDDLLLGPPTPTHFDEQEWDW
jgi:antitoxin MazE